jgi:hypothetical protein
MEKAALRGDDEVVCIRPECFGYKPLADARAVRVRSIKKVYAECNSAAKQVPHGLGVRRLTPSASACHVHRAQT